MKIPAIDTSFLVQFLTELLNTPSPTGYTEAWIACVERALSAYPALELARTRKGALTVHWPCAQPGERRALTAHVDTLGAMVKEIKPNGRLRMTQIGGYAWNSIEGEGCSVYTSLGKTVRGAILFSMASTHVFGPLVNETKRDADNMEVRLDALTTSDKDTRALGIGVGDFVVLDPRVEFTNNFVRSRHLDDKACAACLVSAVKTLHDAGLKPSQPAFLLFSNYEEVGHGAAAGIPADVTELVTVDMAAIGSGQNSDEFHATLCAMDSWGPYHYRLSQHLKQLAEANAIPYKVDIYPYYGSDGEAFWRAGGDVAVALIGPGVDASHNYERTHLDALVATTQWILAYLLAE